ncbi:hypothetical protein ACWEQL_00250 [Kitasatospora sp. NPDC004240]
MNLPAIRNQISAWLAFQDRLRELEGVVSDLPPDATLQGDSLLPAVDADVQLMGQVVADALSRLQQMERRFARSTVNVGVAGDARTGKSTLLQSASGLSDAQIPTGRDLPVTAVRSRITSTTGEPRATLHLRTYEGFRRDVLAPYHDRIGLGPAPRTASEFSAIRYPEAPPDNVGEEKASTTRSSLLNELVEMQRAFPSFRELLVGGTREVPISELASYVAYQPAEDRAAGVERAQRYMAVEHVSVMANFPNADARQLTLVDLPGLGELSPRVTAEKHAAALERDVDVVIMVKRAAPTVSFWGDRDANALATLDLAKGDVAKVGDFAFVLINRHPDDLGRIPVLRQHMAENLRLQDGSAVDVFEADAKDMTAVNRELIPYVLDFITTRLATNDRAVLAGLETAVGSCAASVSAAMDRIWQIVGRSTAGQHQDDLLSAEADQLRALVAQDLQTLLRSLTAEARSGSVDKDYEMAVISTHETIRAWINEGLGMQEGTWLMLAEAAIARDGHGLNFASDELNRTRVEISRRFSAVDGHFADRVAEFQSQVIGILRARFPALLPPGDDPRVELTRFAELLEDAEYPCPDLAGAVRALARTRIDFNTQLYPIVRSELRRIALSAVSPDTGESEVQIRHVSGPSAAASLRSQIMSRSRSGAQDTRNELLKADTRPNLIIYAVAEQFEDEIVRSGSAAQEFRNVVRSYRDGGGPVEQQVSFQLAQLRSLTRHMQREARKLGGD